MTLYMRDLEKREEGRKYTIYSLVERGILTAQIGANELAVSVEELEADMISNGFKIPQEV